LGAAPPARGGPDAARQAQRDCSAAAAAATHTSRGPDPPPVALHQPVWQPPSCVRAGMLPAPMARPSCVPRCPAPLHPKSQPSAPDSRTARMEVAAAKQLLLISISVVFLLAPHLQQPSFGSMALGAKVPFPRVEMGQGASSPSAQFSVPHGCLPWSASSSSVRPSHVHPPLCCEPVTLARAAASHRDGHLLTACADVQQHLTLRASPVTGAVNTPCQVRRRPLPRRPPPSSPSLDPSLTRPSRPDPR
jgi:hypothetical protein